MKVPTYTFSTTLTITPQQISDQLIAAFEGGSNYWYARLDPLAFDLSDRELRIATCKDLGLDEGMDDYWHAWLPMTEAGVELGDIEDDEVTWTLNAAKIQQGIRLMSRCSHGRRRLAEIVNDEGDADTADCFLQFCTMGEVVFG